MRAAFLTDLPVLPSQTQTTSIPTLPPQSPPWSRQRAASATARVPQTARTLPSTTDTTTRVPTIPSKPDTARNASQTAPIAAHVTPRIVSPQSVKINETTDNQCTSKLAELRQCKQGLRSQYQNLVSQVAFLDECGRKAQHRLAESQRVTSAMRLKRELVEEMQEKKTEYGMWINTQQHARLEKIEEERKRKEALKEKKMDLFESRRKEVGETRQAIGQLKAEYGIQRNEYERESRLQAQQLRDQHEQRLDSATKFNTEARNSLYEKRRQERNENEATIKQRVAEQQQKNAVQAYRVKQEEKRVIDNVRNTIVQQNRQKMEVTMNDRAETEEAEITYYANEVEKLKEAQKKARKRAEESERRLRITTNTENPFLAGPSSPLRLPRS